MLRIELADKDGLEWAQHTVEQFHYLKKRVDVRCSPISYAILDGDERMGCLIFGRPECTFVRGWYGSLNQVEAGECRLSRWCLLNLARVWLHPDIQHDGCRYIENAATWVIAQALRRVVADYLICKPPVWMQEPYEIRDILSYCDTRIHTGTLYRASNFALVRKNKSGIETYRRSVRRLTHAEKQAIAARSQEDKRCKKLRAARMQGVLWETIA